MNKPLLAHGPLQNKWKGRFSHRLVAANFNVDHIDVPLEAERWTDPGPRTEPGLRTNSLIYHL